MPYSSPRHRRPCSRITPSLHLPLLGFFAALVVGVLHLWVKVVSPSQRGLTPSVIQLRGAWEWLSWNRNNPTASGLALLLLLIALAMVVLYRCLQGQSPERLAARQRYRDRPLTKPARRSQTGVAPSPPKSRQERRRERLEQAVLDRPEDPNTWIERGVMHENDRHFRDAIANYAEGLTHHPDNGRLWFSHGLAHAKAGHFRKALDSYNKALAYQPKDPEIWHAQGDALLELKRFEEAIVSLETVLHHSPRFGHIWGDRGFALFQLGRYEAAAKDLAEAVKSDPKDQRSWFHLGEVYLMLDQLDEALNSSDRALKLHPQSEALQRQNRHVRARLGAL